MKISTTVLACLVSLACCGPIQLPSDFNALWFDAGFYGAYVDETYQSCDYVSPKLSFLRTDSRCDQSYIFMGLRGDSVPKPGPAIFDAQGALVWMEEKYGQVTDVKVQRYRSQEFLTFWAGTAFRGHGHGEGRYYMVGAPVCL